MASAGEILAAKKQELAQTKLERDNLFHKLQRAHDLALIVDGNPELRDEFNARCARLTESLTQFEQLLDRCKIIDADINPDFDAQKYREQRELCERTYFKTFGVYERLSKVTHSGPQVNSTFSHNSTLQTSYQMNVQLPQIKIKPFDGTLKDWPEFRDTFISLYHTNPSLSPTAKFHYLKSNLRGAALIHIRDLLVTDLNYDIAWRQLNKLYENNRMLGAELVRKLMDFPEVRKENGQDLSQFMATFSECFSSLQALPILNLADFIVLHLGLRCLPNQLQKAFEQGRDQDSIPTVHDMLKFIHVQTQVLELCNTKNKEQPSKEQKPLGHTAQQNKDTNKKFSYNWVTAQNEPSKLQECPKCSQDHQLFRCPKFVKETVEQRHSFVKEKNLCYNCLRANHRLSACSVKATCKICNMRHNTLLHLNKTVTAITSQLPVAQPVDQQVTQLRENPEVESSNQPKPTIIAQTSKRVLLGTAQIRVKGSRGKFLRVRAAIDSCAMDSFITTKCAQRLGLQIEPSDSEVSGLSDLPINRIEGAVECHIKPLTRNGPELSTHALVIGRITTALPVVPVPDSIIAAYQNLDLADIHFASPKDIDFLIGCDLFPLIYTGKKVQKSPDGPYALESIFGWVITGKYTEVGSNSQSHSAQPHASKKKPPASPSLIISTYDPVDQALRRFFETEDIKVDIPLHPEEKLCNDTFEKLHYREKSGRYVVPLMFKPNSSELGSSHDQALSRWLSTEKKIHKNPEEQAEYIKFMTEYENLGHMVRVPTYEHGKGKYYVPHHCIFKPSSSTTKARVVFDGNMKSSNCLSLNDILLPGPKLQLDIIDILSRFRLHKVVFCADICKMYRQFNIIPEHRPYQHILWRPDPNSPILEFQLQTITYGLTCAPFTALKTMRQIGQDQQDIRPQLERVINEEMFVDDILTGKDTVQQAKELKNEIFSGLEEAGLEARKCASNSPELLSDIPADRIESTLTFSEDNSLKLLGVQWLAAHDCFSFKIEPFEIEYTRRAILSACARLFDPLGILSVIVVRFKLILKQTWILGLTWDQEVPENLKQEWKSLASSLPQLSGLKIPRRVIIDNAIKVTLIGFSDASTEAMGAVTYLRTEDSLGNCQVKFLLAKSRIAPVKTISVPNLELCGSVLLSKLLYKIHNLYSSRITLNNCYAFTDSMVTLCWLKTLPCSLKTFQANRVTYILEKTEPTIWHHVPGDQNPADLISRGCQVSEVLTSKFYLEGPEWLKMPISSWPITQSIKPSLDSGTGLTQSQPTPVLIVTHNTVWLSLIERYSSYTQLKRITAWVLRFCHNAKTAPEKRNLGHLSTDELRQAEYTLIRSVQQAHFKDEIVKLNTGMYLPRHFRQLNIKLRENNLLRVRGRLVEAAWYRGKGDPILLPKKSTFTTLLINSYHKTYLHAGPRTLQSLLCRKYWILSARQAIRSCISKCIPCFKAKPTLLQPKMGVLPIPRVNQGRVFINVGTDFGGPYYTKDTSLRKARTVKSYFCLFLCLASKSCHLELVSDLSTPAFIAAFDRFLNRRGLPQSIHSDLGSNYQGCKNYFSEVHEFLSKQENQTPLKNYAADMEIKWYFSPGTGATFGGVWESQIKAVKYHLKRTIGDQTLTFEEMTTVLTRVEAMLNSRPLCPLSDDPTELDALTPGHFLIGAPLVARPEPEPSETVTSCRDRWRLISTISHHFWQRWNSEYLHTLTQRAKWTTDTENIRVGQLVLINDTHLPPTRWAMGRVLEVFPGKDHVVRVVKVKTKTGTLTRPVNKLAPLPIDPEHHDVKSVCLTATDNTHTHSHDV